MNRNAETLVYVCQASLSELEALLDGLTDADPRTLQARLRQLESVATTLSGALDKLSNYLTELPSTAVPATPRMPVDDGGLLLRAARKLVAATDAYFAPDKSHHSTPTGARK
ncbi:hypothetical protein [uncultured Maritimibacter sp.]|uniref:hypothetical protein n=1 Tax=uncultured Maritimibacter sp. TaxID=991866 RepID=UPI00259347FA|nr:hypothetical protein [uncultured Maritimibacter sp.]